MPVHFCISCRLLWAFVPTLDQKKPEIIGFNTRRGLTHLSKGRRLAPRGGISVKSTKKRFLDGCLACLMNSCILISPNQIRKGANHDQEKNPGLRPSQTYSRGDSVSFPTDSSEMDFWHLRTNRRSFYTSSLSWLQIETAFPFIPMMLFALFYKSPWMSTSNPGIP